MPLVGIHPVCQRLTILCLRLVDSGTDRSGVGCLRGRSVAGLLALLGEHLAIGVEGHFVSFVWYEVSLQSGGSPAPIPCGSLPTVTLCTAAVDALCLCIVAVLPTMVEGQFDLLPLAGLAVEAALGLVVFHAVSLQGQGASLPPSVPLLELNLFKGRGRVVALRGSDGFQDLQQFVAVSGAVQQSGSKVSGH